MFDRYILASDFKRIEARFSMAKLTEGEIYKPSFNIAPGSKSYVMINSQTRELEIATFGIQNVGYRCETVYFVRAEGDRNMNDNPAYTGSKAIFMQPDWSIIIRNQRCLVLADAFVVGLDDSPHLVYLRNNKRPFTFAAVYKRKKNKETGEETLQFAIITTTANQLLSNLGKTRMPVILPPEHEITWLHTRTELCIILDLLYPYPSKLMNAYPVTTAFTDYTRDDKLLVIPQGEPVCTEFVYQPYKKQKKVSNPANPTIAERAEYTRNAELNKKTVQTG